MSTTKEFMTFIYEQVEHLGNVRYKKMFGEYALYCDEKVVALICDNQLFIKPTPQGQTFIGPITSVPPYKGAKNYFLIEETIENSEWLCELIQITANALPKPKPKPKPKTKTTSST